MKSDYSRWGILHDYLSFTSFKSDFNFQEGVHRIWFGEGFVELLVSGRPLENPKSTALPTFFSGAVPNREGTAAPYFSGLGIAKELELGFLAFSDPSLAADSTISLGWYAGWMNFDARSSIAKICREITSKAERRLLLVGGSAGGFAALSLAALIPSAKVLAWNPQVNFLDYVTSDVKAYLKFSVPEIDWEREDWYKTASHHLSENGILFDICQLDLPGEILYLQNYSDWHVKKHMTKFIDNFNMTTNNDVLYQSQLGKVIAIGNFGVGHRAPDRELIKNAISAYIIDIETPLSVYEYLSGQGQFEDIKKVSMPRDLRKSAAEIIEGFRFVKIVENDHVQLRLEQIADFTPPIFLRTNSMVLEKMRGSLFMASDTTLNGFLKLTPSWMSAKAKL